MSSVRSHSAGCSSSIGVQTPLIPAFAKTISNRPKCSTVMSIALHRFWIGDIAGDSDGLLPKRADFLPQPFSSFGLYIGQRNRSTVLGKTSGGSGPNATCRTSNKGDLLFKHTHGDSSFLL